MGLAEGLARIGKKNGLPLYTCAEKMDLSRLGIEHGACIDKEKIHNLIGYKLDLKKDAGQRRECGCIESIDIGMYDTCINGCKYCYATSGLEGARRRMQQHNPLSPLLIGQLKGDEMITDRDVKSDRDNQISLFDLPEMYMKF